MGGGMERGRAKGATSTIVSRGADLPNGEALCGCGHIHITIEGGHDVSAREVSRQRRYQIRKQLLRRCRICGGDSGGATRCWEHRQQGKRKGRDGLGKWMRCGICKETGHNARSHYVDEPWEEEE